MWLCVKVRFELQGKITYESVMSYTPDTPEYTSYLWFQWCWFYNEKYENETSMQVAWTGTWDWAEIILL